MIRHTIAPSNYCDIVVLFSLTNYVLWCCTFFSLLSRTYTLHGKSPTCYELQTHRPLLGVPDALKMVRAVVPAIPASSPHLQVHLSLSPPTNNCSTNGGEHCLKKLSSSLSFWCAFWSSSWHLHLMICTTRFSVFLGHWNDFFAEWLKCELNIWVVVIETTKCECFRSSMCKWLCL